MLNQCVPNIELAATNGQQINLTALTGQFIILYFYPKDNTPGCTTESAAFRDAFAEFSALNVCILGVSRDSIKSHENFKSKLALPFELIADVDEALCSAFNVIKMKNMYGKQARGIERSTFLINPEGKIIAEWRGVKVAEHVLAVLETLKSLL